MFVLFKTAMQSLLGNGLKTWLNVFVLSIAFVLIILMQAFLEGWSRQAVSDSEKWEIADGQYWTSTYDPYDPFSLDSSALTIPFAMATEIEVGKIEPILIAHGSIYPEGKMQSVLLKGIRPSQKLIALPTHLLEKGTEEIPVLIGSMMAKQSKLKQDDQFTLQWRDANGSFQAMDVRVVGIFSATVPTVDMGQMWMPLDRLQDMLQRPNTATLLLKSEALEVVELDGWDFKSVEKLNEQTMALVEAKSGGMTLMYGIFLLLAMIAIFDTQTLSIFRRQREIGTFIALGMTRQQVVGLFTLEGTMNAVLAILLGALYGIPLFVYLGIYGIPLPMDMSSFGIPIADTMYPYYTPKLILGTVLFILIITALVSYLPARKIAKMKPTDAIRGKAFL
jgi:putative ABC transport system permease protein